jgi:hypothetical protein
MNNLNVMKLRSIVPFIALLLVLVAMVALVVVPAMSETEVIQESMPNIADTSLG